MTIHFRYLDPVGLTTVFSAPTPACPLGSLVIPFAHKFSLLYVQTTLEHLAGFHKPQTLLSTRSWPSLFLHVQNSESYASLHAIVMNPRSPDRVYFAWAPRAAVEKLREPIHFLPIACHLYSWARAVSQSVAKTRLPVTTS